MALSCLTVSVENDDLERDASILVLIYVFPTFRPLMGQPNGKVGSSKVLMGVRGDNPVICIHILLIFLFA